MATRHQIRQAVISILYAREMGSEMPNFIDEFLEERKIRNNGKEFTLELVNGVIDSLERIDQMLNTRLSDLNNISLVERSILRLGVYELLDNKTDKAIVINEAIELAKDMGSDSAPKLINGVLDAIKVDL